MEPNAPVLQGLEYELMLLSRYYLRPHHDGDKVLDRSASILLSRLENVPPMTLKELAAALRLDVSTVHRQAAALLRQGLLCHVRNDAGELARRLRPTPAGLAELARTREINQLGMGRVMADWPEEKRGRLLALLQSFNEGVEALEGSPWPRGRSN